MKRSKLWIEVDKMLWEEWDPIGINNCGGPNDEYQGYVPSIVKLLEERGDESKISKLLHQHANINMGLSTQIDDHKKVTEKLRQLVL